MSDTNVRKLIANAYLQLEKLCELSSGDACRLLVKLTESETDNEKGHRRIGDAFNARHRFPATTIVKFFVVRSVLEPHAAPRDWLDVAELNDRTVLGSQLHAVLHKRASTAHLERFFEHPDIYAIRKLDYIADLAGGTAAAS